MPKEMKANAAEYEERVNKVYELLVNGARRYQVLQYVAKQTDWGVEERQIDNYIADARAALADEAEYHRARELGRAIAGLNDLYARSIKLQDLQRALAARRELNQLLGLYAPPAAQTIRLEGGDMDTLKVMIDAMTERGIKPSEMFESMMAIIATEHDANG